MKVHRRPAVFETAPTNTRSNICFALATIAFLTAFVLGATGTSSSTQAMVTILHLISIVLFLAAFVLVGLGISLRVTYHSLRHK